MKQGKGSIINISSRSGLVGIPGAAAYAASKSAVRNHTQFRIAGARLFTLKPCAKCSCPGQDARNCLSCETDFEQAWKELADAAESLDRRVTAAERIEDNRKVTYARYWNRMVGLKISIEEETVPALREKWMRGLLALFLYSGADPCAGNLLFGSFGHCDRSI